MMNIDRPRPEEILSYRGRALEFVVRLAKRFTGAAIILIVLGANWLAIAQIPTQLPPPPCPTLRNSIADPRCPDPAAEAARQKAIQLKQANALKRLNALAGDADLIADPADRVRLLAKIASVLWNYDELRARSLFKLVYAQAINIPKSEDELFARRPTCGSVRVEISQLLRSLDARLAAQLASAGALESCDYGPRNRATSEDSRSEALTDVALAIVDGDAAGAYRLGIKSLETGIVFRTGDLITKLFATNPSLGEEFLNACLTRISVADVNGLEVHDLITFMFHEEVELDAKQRATANSDQNAELKKRFARKLLAAALAASDRLVSKIETQQRGREKPDEYISDPDVRKVWTRAATIQEMAASYYSMMLNVIEGVRRYDPDQLPAAQALIDRLGRWMDPLDRKHFLVFYGNGDTPESLAAEAESTRDPEQKKVLYEYAVDLAQQNEEDAKALAYAAKLDDPDLRQYFTDNVWMRKIAMTQAAQFADVDAFIEKIKGPEQRLGSLMMIAEQTTPTDAKQRTAYLARLDEAKQLALSGAPGRQQASLIMRLARLYAAVDPNRGFEETTKAIQIVNSAPEKPLADKTHWQFRPQPFNSTDPITVFFSDPRLFETLAKADYDRTMQLAATFSNPSLAITAELLALRTALPPKALPGQ